MSAECGVTLATLDARLREIESLLKILISALAEKDESDDDAPIADLDGNVIPLRKRPQEPL